MQIVMILKITHTNYVAHAHTLVSIARFKYLHLTGKHRKVYHAISTEHMKFLSHMSLLNLLY